jgi:hypothetical protein
VSDLEAGPVLAGLKIAFLVLLYLFVWRVARGAQRDLRQAAAGRVPVAGSETVFGADNAAAAPPQVRPPRPSQANALRAAVQPRLTVRTSTVLPVGRSYAIDHSATIGRSPDSELRIEDGYASSAHARVFPRGQFLLVEDLGSTNGTTVNGRDLSPGQPYTLRVHDRVRIGETEFEYEE